ncbi:MAG: hypothetical protein AVDCRST_MAG71-2851, partial [uncultured Lysobacter sp.]
CKACDSTTASFVNCPATRSRAGA